MAYMSKEEVKQVRENLKKTFGKRFKFSVTRYDYSGVNVKIMEGDIEDWSKYLRLKNEDLMGENEKQAQRYYTDEVKKGYFDINHYWISETWKGEAEEIFLKIWECCQVGGGHYNRNADDPAADYADFTYFVNMGVGKWNKPYVCKEEKRAAA